MAGPAFPEAEHATPLLALTIVCAIALGALVGAVLARALFS